MGWTQVTLNVVGRVSRHNSDQDKRDDGDWADFCKRIEAIAQEHRYADLTLDVGWYDGA